MAECGNNEALDAINEVRDGIKDALAEGKAALADIQSKASEALSELNNFKVELPDTTSLQGDIQALIGQVQGDFAGALAEFQEAWGSVLSSEEIQGYIDQVTSIASDPLSLLEFDPCKDIPNIEFETTTDENGETVRTRVDKALASLTPNVNPTAIEAFSPQVLDISAQPSTNSPSGETRSTVFSDYIRLIGTPSRNAITAHYKTILDPLYAIRKELKADPLWPEVQRKTRKQNFNVEEFRRRNKLTTEEQRFYERYITEAEDPIEIARLRKTKVSELMTVYERTATDMVEAQAYTEALATFNRNEGASDDASLIEELKGIIDDNLEAAKAKANYDGRLAASGAALAQSLLGSGFGG